MLAGTAFALLGMIASDILGTPRMLFAFARDGLLSPLPKVWRLSQYAEIRICYPGPGAPLVVRGGLTSRKSTASVSMSRPVKVPTRALSVLR